jgi:hypothetical protein
LKIEKSRDEVQGQTHWTITIDDAELEHADIPDATKALIWQLSQSLLISSQLCALAELTSAIEKSQALASIGKIAMTEDMMVELQKFQGAQDAFRQLKLECQHRIMHPGGLACISPGYAKLGCKGRLDCADFKPRQHEDAPEEIDNCPGCETCGISSHYTLYHDPDPARYRTGPKRNPIVDDPRNRASMRKLWHWGTSPDEDLIMKKPDEEPSCAFDPDKDGFCERYCGPCIAIKEKQPQSACGSFKEAKPNV